MSDFCRMDVLKKEGIVFVSDSFGHKTLEVTIFMRLGSDCWLLFFLMEMTCKANCTHRAKSCWTSFFFIDHVVTVPRLKTWMSVISKLLLTFTLISHSSSILFFDHHIRSLCNCCFFFLHGDHFKSPFTPEWHLSILPQKSVQMIFCWLTLFSLDLIHHWFNKDVVGKRSLF